MLAGVGGLVFYIVLLGFAVGEQVVPWAGWAWLAVGMFAGFVVRLARRDGVVAAYLFAIVVTKAMLLLSLLFIDNAGGQGWLFTVVVAFKPILAAAMGFVRFRLPGGRAERRAIDATAVLLTATVALFGDKFLSLIVLVGYYLLPGVAGGALRRRVAWTRAVAAAALLGMAVSGLTVFVYSDYGRLDAGRTGERLFGRFTGQGQLWYAAMREAPAVLGGDGAQRARLAAVMRDPAPDRRAFDARVGIFYMVARFAPDPIRRSVFASEGRVQFTGASEAYAALVFGQAAMWGFALLTGVLFGVLAAFMQRALVAGALPGFVGGAYLFMGAYTMANQAAPWVVFGPRTLTYAAVVIAADLLYRAVLARRPRKRT